MTLEEIRDYCLGKKLVEESFPFDKETLVFKVAGKAFLLTGINNKPVRFNVKCDPEKAIELREQYTCVTPGYHMNKKHWNTITVDGTVNANILQRWIDNSYLQVLNGFSKLKRKQLGV